MLVKALRKESREDVILRRLRPLIRCYGKELRDLASECVEDSVARELIRHAPWTAGAVIRFGDDNPVPESPANKKEREEKSA
jgi:hypothetical protein